MENIFEHAKFGDKFVTRDGRTALYIDKNFNRKTGLVDSHSVFIEGNEVTTLYNNDGTLSDYYSYTEFEDCTVEQLDDDIVAVFC